MKVSGNLSQCHTTSSWQDRADFRVCSGHREGNERGPGAPGFFLRCRDIPGKAWDMGLAHWGPSRPISGVLSRRPCPLAHGGRPSNAAPDPLWATVLLWHQKPWADFRRPCHAQPQGLAEPPAAPACPSCPTATRQSRSPCSHHP